MSLPDIAVGDLVRLRGRDIWREVTNVRTRRYTHVQWRHGQKFEKGSPYRQIRIRTDRGLPSWVNVLTVVEVQRR